jgi:hypothetical protein
LSHENAEVLKEFADAYIDVYELYPHSSHLTQPLDVNFFRSWRAALNRVSHFPLFSLTPPQFYKVESRNMQGNSVSDRREALLRACQSALHVASALINIEQSWRRAG